MARSLALVVLLACASASAGARLFPQPSLLTLSPEVTAPPAPAITEPPEPKLLLAMGGTAAMLATPTSLMLGSWVGSLSSNLYASALPALLIALIIPPVAVVFTEWITAERKAPGRLRWGPALPVALLAQAAWMAVAILFGISGTSAAGIAIFTLGDILLLPTVTTVMMQATQRPAPVVSVPLLSGKF